MLQSKNRLAKTRDFNLIMKYGRWVNGQFLDLKFLELERTRANFPKKENPDEFERQLKVAFTVGLKISKSAVARNRVKRQLREMVRLLLKENKLKVGEYLLFVAKKEILKQEYLAIGKEVIGLLKRAGVLK